MADFICDDCRKKRPSSQKRKPHEPLAQGVPSIMCSECAVYWAQADVSRPLIDYVQDALLVVLVILLSPFLLFDWAVGKCRRSFADG